MYVCSSLSLLSLASEGGKADRRCSSAIASLPSSTILGMVGAFGLAAGACGAAGGGAAGGGAAGGGAWCCRPT